METTLQLNFLSTTANWSKKGKLSSNDYTTVMNIRALASKKKSLIH